MSATVTNGRRSDPVRLPDKFGPLSARSVLPESDPRTVQDFSVGISVRDALVKHYGSVKELAFALGEGAGRAVLDPSLMNREFEAGKLGRCDGLDPDGKAIAARAIGDAWGILSSPEQFFLRNLHDIRNRCEQLEQFLPLLKTRLA